MKIHKKHQWNLEPKSAINLQKELKKEISLNYHINLEKIKTVAGGDVSYSKKTNLCFAGIIIFSYPEMEIIEKSGAILEAGFPYIPGLLSFRELPPLIKAFEKISTKPDLIVLDSQGIAHPRQFGLASHAGLIFDIPSIGWAKTHLFGDFEEPGSNQGDFSPLTHPKSKEKIGWAIRTKKDCKLTFVSPGHKITLEQTLAFSLDNLGKYRMPAITRIPHFYSNELRLKNIE